MKEEWVTTLPSGWSMKQIRHIFRIHNGATPKSSESEYWNGDINWITPEDLGNNDGKEIVESRRKITPEGFANSGVSLSPAGSIAVSTRAPIGHLAKTTIPSCVNQGCRLLEPREGNPDYWYYASIAAKPILVSRGQGTTFMELPRQSLASVKLPVPPDEEQKTIARFLDFKTAQIDSLIKKKKALLDKLTEKRTALISHAVTKGLDPSVTKKDSGVAWLGDIPVHWTVSKLAYLSESLQTGPFGSQLHAEEYIEGGVPLINPTDISNGEVFENAKVTVGEDVVERLSRHKLELGDIVIARRGEMGRAGLVRERNVGWLCGTGSLRARLNKKALNPEFLLYQFSMRGVAEYLSLQSVGSTMDNLNTSILGRLPVIAPPLHEQAALVLHLRKLSESIDSQAAKVEEVISSLQEYRSSLITNAVTGKVDVRDFAILQIAEGIAS